MKEMKKSLGDWEVDFKLIRGMELIRCLMKRMMRLFRNLCLLIAIMLLLIVSIKIIALSRRLIKLVKQLTLNNNQNNLFLIKPKINQSTKRMISYYMVKKTMEICKLKKPFMIIFQMILKINMKAVNYFHLKIINFSKICFLECQVLLVHQEFKIILLVEIAIYIFIINKTMLDHTIINTSIEIIQI